MPAEIPRITVEEDPVPGSWTLFATSYGMKSPAGLGEFDTKEAAEAAAEKLRRQLTEQAARRKPSKAALRREHD